MAQQPEETKCPSCDWYHDEDGFCQVPSCTRYIHPEDRKRLEPQTKRASAPPDLAAMIRTPVPSDRPSGFDTLSPTELDEKKERAKRGTEPPSSANPPSSETRSSYKSVLVSGSMAPLRSPSLKAPEETPAADDKEPST